MNWEIVFAALLLLIGLDEAIGEPKRFKRKLSLAENIAAIRFGRDSYEPGSRPPCHPFAAPPAERQLSLGSSSRLLAANPRAAPFAA